MEDILFNILGIGILGIFAVSGFQSVGDNLESQVNQVSHCIDQAGSKYSGC